MSRQERKKVRLMKHEILSRSTFRFASRPVQCVVVVLSLVATLSAQKKDSVANSPAKNIDLYDGFENAPLSPIWETRRLVPSALEFQNKVVLAGKGALKITVHNFDKKAVHTDGVYTERDELLEAEQFNAQENESYEHSFNMFIPADFPIVPTRLVIAQWKQFCPAENKCSKGHPVLAIRYVDGVLTITQTFGQTKEVLYEQKGEFRNRWLNFRFQVRFSSNQGMDGWQAGRGLRRRDGQSRECRDRIPSPGPVLLQDGLVSRRSVRADVNLH